MPDIIHLLTDSVANQIAAGEVVQRPASAVKELMENSIDAGATKIMLIIKDAGRTLIQVTDNGCGMSETDARMSFERHATSKIHSADDLLTIRTKGFRGEALASIAAIAQVEMKTRQTGKETGTLIRIDGSLLINQEVISCNEGTSIAVKSLFYNVPARRNFLKSNPVETKHIIEEFQRIALAHPEVGFSMNHNGLEVFQLKPATLRQRIVAIFGPSINEKLVPVEEDTTIMSVSGFVGRPEMAKKTRGEQFFFVNQRYIRDNYLQHAVQNAYEELLPHGSFASYFLFIETDPAKIDVNIHPTKAEIKFEDERSVYAIIRSAVKRALGQYSVTPTLDFTLDTSVNIPHITKDTKIVAPQINLKPDYNPFHQKEEKDHSWTIPSRYPSVSRTAPGWQKMYEDNGKDTPVQTPPSDKPQEFPSPEFASPSDTHPTPLFQLNGKYIVTIINNSLTIIDRQGAQERILYEKYLESLDKNLPGSQQQLFPTAIDFGAEDSLLLEDITEDIRRLGFDIRPFGKQTFVIHGSPADIPAGSEKELIESLLEQFKNNSDLLRINKRDNIAKTFARNITSKFSANLSDKEIRQLIDDLFSCETPQANASGKPILFVLSEQDILKRFGKTV